ncbi:glycoside hydrolase family 15 protein [Actinomadura sp. NPDC048955]|uniref:glycoside hydrolase family 15 protein n=1 Tax=Actinomadura sp. NPDC048955 TaxID=3158228 RepID=UPI0033C51263
MFSSSPFTPAGPGDSPRPPGMGEVPIKDLAFLYDCRTAAAVSPGGTVLMFSPGYVDDPSVFTRLLGGRGQFRLAPMGCSVPDERRYIPGTNVLETTWLTPTGDVKVVDALDWSPEKGSGQTLLRLVEVTRGTVVMDVDCDVHFDYGSIPASWQRREYQGYREGRTSHDGVELVLRSDMALRFQGSRAAARVTLHEGDRVFIALGWGDRELPRTYKKARKQLTTTIQGWRSWLATGNIPQHELRQELVRDLLAMKGACLDTGAVIAAPTFSLPEAPGGPRNWDYRACWPRDSKEVLEALRLAGFEQEGHAYIRFLLGLPDFRTKPQIMFGPRGQFLLPERVLHHLAGYGGATPVNVGNLAAKQLQLDLMGQVNRTIRLFEMDRLTPELYRLVRYTTDTAGATWNVPDAGPWEQRGEPRLFNGSRLMQWTALVDGAEIARAFGKVEDAIRWEAQAKSFYEELLEEAQYRGKFTAAKGMDAMDVYCVRFALEGFLPATDPLFVATVRAVEEELTHLGLHFRYLNAQYVDGLEGEEKMFLIGSYWLVEAYVAMGEPDRARKLLRELRTFDSRILLLPEEVDPETGEHWGNTPQKFVHAARAKAIMALARAEGWLSAL